MLIKRHTKKAQKSIWNINKAHQDALKGHTNKAHKKAHQDGIKRHTIKANKKGTSKRHIKRYIKKAHQKGINKANCAC